MTDTAKRCSTCRKPYPATDEFFEKHKQCTGGISSRCKGCAARRTRKWRKKNRAAIIERWNARYKIGHDVARKLRDRHYREHQPIKLRAMLLSSRTRVRAGRLKIPVDLAVINPTNLEALLHAAEHCPVCGNQIEYVSRDDRRGGHANYPRAASLDRIIPALGYVAGNVAIICWRCNVLKRDASLAELEKLVRWLKKVSR